MVPARHYFSVALLLIIILSKSSFKMYSFLLISELKLIRQLTCYVLIFPSFVAMTLLITPRIVFGGQPDLLIHSENFTANDPIPVEFTCSGDNRSPQLTWTGIPTTTKTLALIVRDPDAPMGSYVHWVIFNLPAKVSGLPAGVPATSTIAQGGRQGINGGGKIGYQGPCPPPGPTHHYHFRLYALDRSLNLTPDATAAEVEAALAGHVVAAGELVGTFAR